MAKKAKERSGKVRKAKRGPVKQVRARKAAVAAKRAAAVKKARKPPTALEYQDRAFGDDVAPEGRLPDFVTQPPVQTPGVDQPMEEGLATLPERMRMLPVEEQVWPVPAHLQDPPTGDEAPSTPPARDDVHGTENDPAALAAKAARITSTQERLKEENRTRQERNAKLRR
jgi:hypothetical protein